MSPFTEYIIVTVNIRSWADVLFNIFGYNVLVLKPHKTGCSQHLILFNLIQLR
jgi:hypothetical protein